MKGSISSHLFNIFICSAKSSGGLGRLCFNGASVVCCSGSLLVVFGASFGNDAGFGVGSVLDSSWLRLTGTARTVVESGLANNDWSRGALSLDRICRIFLISRDESTCVGAMAAGGEPKRCPLSQTVNIYLVERCLSRFSLGKRGFLRGPGQTHSSIHLI